jgi:hypothetical protein
VETFLDRYLAGQHEVVWQELQAYGGEVMTQPLFEDAWAVARETMRRIRYNLFDLAVPRLRNLGYNFGYELVKPPDNNLGALEQFASAQEWIGGQPPLHTPPEVDGMSHILAFNDLTGGVPLSLHAFWQEIGGVNFMGFHPIWNREVNTHRHSQQTIMGFDPIFVYAFDENHFTDFAEWQDAVNCRYVNGNYQLVVAPDHYHKMNVSGGPPYTIELPNQTADAVLCHEWHNTTFINYLRICCQFGGLPGLERIQDILTKELAEIRVGMLAF